MGTPAEHPEAETVYDYSLQSGKPDFKSYTNCDVLRKIEKILFWGFANGQRILVEIAAMANVTSSQHKQVLEELDVLRCRLAAAAVLSFTKLAIVVVYLIITGVLYIKKCVKKHRVAALETNLKEMESRLQERKAIRRSAAAKAKRSPSPTQE